MSFLTKRTNTERLLREHSWLWSLSSMWNMQADKIVFKETIGPENSREFLSHIPWKWDKTVCIEQWFVKHSLESREGVHAIKIFQGRTLEEGLAGFLETCAKSPVFDFLIRVDLVDSFGAQQVTVYRVMRRYHLSWSVRMEKVFGSRKA